MTGKVTNGGSAIGEAIGHYMESVIQKYITQYIDNYNCHFLSQTGHNPITGKESKKLLLYDSFGNDYNIDGVITNEKMQPLILLESKYIRYKKHNRDKGSWICNAHSAIRKHYPSIRSSIAILAGNWSKSSLAMLQSCDVNFFLINFSLIVRFLSEKGIDFNWEENDKEKAMLAWNKYSRLPENDREDIAIKMVDSIKNNLFTLLDNILDDSKIREVSKVILEIVSDHGETIRKKFETTQEAISYLEDFSPEIAFDNSSCITIFDIPENQDH